MATIKKEELIRIIYEGYGAALDGCFDNKSLYAQGFLDGMMFQKDGTIPKSNFDKMLEKFENELKNE
jgi:hypothetical protein